MVFPPGGSPDVDEIEALYRRLFMPLVRRATWRHRLSKEDAVEIVQEAFLLALVKMTATDFAQVWLARVVDHLALNFCRKTRRRAALIRRWTAPPPESALDDPEEA